VDGKYTIKLGQTLFFTHVKHFVHHHPGEFIHRITTLPTARTKTLVIFIVTIRMRRIIEEDFGNVHFDKVCLFLASIGKLIVVPAKTIRAFHWKCQIIFASQSDFPGGGIPTSLSGRVHGELIPSLAPTPSILHDEIRIFYASSTRHVRAYGNMLVTGFEDVLVVNGV